jgi:hypothetical protein
MRRCIATLDSWWRGGAAVDIFMPEDVAEASVSLARLGVISWASQTPLDQQVSVV